MLAALAAVPAVASTAFGQAGGRPEWRLVSRTGSQIVKIDRNARVTFPRPNEVHFKFVNGGAAPFHAVFKWSDPTPGRAARNQVIAVGVSSMVVVPTRQFIHASVSIDAAGLTSGDHWYDRKDAEAGHGDGPRKSYTIPGKAKFRFWDEKQVVIRLYLNQGASTRVLLATYVFRQVQGGVAPRPGPAPAPGPGPAPQQWRYTGPMPGWFAPAGNGRWVERNTKATFEFREVGRNRSFVELYDRSRDITVRLYDKICMIRTPNSGGRFAYLYTRE